MRTHSSKGRRHSYRQAKKVCPARKSRKPGSRVRAGRGRAGPSRVPKVASREEVRGDSGGFLSLLLERASWETLEQLKQRRHGAGRRAYLLSRGQLLVALVFHCTVSWAGTLAEHLDCLLGIKMAESTLSERRQALPFAVFGQLLERLLQPVSTHRQEGFWGLWRLVALDGVSFSLPNTAAVKGRCKKGGNQRGRAAFAKLYCAALVELIWHNPLAAAIGLEGQSEWQLALGLMAQLPPQCLLLGDRLYGCGAFIAAAQAALKPLKGHFLFRVRSRLKVRRVLHRYADGSRWVQIVALDPTDYNRVAATLEVREIYATLRRKGHRPVVVRLWTSLTCEQASAVELVSLYASRWEQELYFRELKWHLGINDLLRSQTPETAAQEVAAMIIGSSLIAHERAKLKPGEQGQHRISFIKLWETLQPLWLTLLLGADILTESQKQTLCERFYDLAAKFVMPRKRVRSCPRTIRQNFLPWPRTKIPRSSEGPVRITIRRPR
jgi:hypothetical protein